MSVVGIGIDLVHVERLRRALERTPAMRERLFTPAEQERPLASLAARFAAKEAVAKALGAPPGLHWRDAEVVGDADGRPALRLTGTVAEAAARWGVLTPHVSLSHDAGMATAVVVLERTAVEHGHESAAGPGQGPADTGSGQDRREQAERTRAAPSDLPEEET